MAKREPRPDWRAHKALEKIPTGSMEPYGDFAQLPEVLRHPTAPSSAIRRALLEQRRGGR